MATSGSEDELFHDAHEQDFEMTNLDEEFSESEANEVKTETVSSTGMLRESTGEENSSEIKENDSGIQNSPTRSYGELDRNEDSRAGDEDLGPDAADVDPSTVEASETRTKNLESNENHNVPTSDDVSVENSSLTEQKEAAVSGEDKNCEKSVTIVTELEVPDETSLDQTPDEKNCDSITEQQDDDSTDLQKSEQQIENPAENSSDESPFMKIQREVAKARTSEKFDDLPEPMEIDDNEKQKTFENPVRTPSDFLMAQDIDAMLSIMNRSDDEENHFEPPADPKPRRSDYGDDLQDDLLMEVMSPRPISSGGSSPSKRTSIVDSLLNKIRRKTSTSDSSGTEMTKFQKVLSGSEDDLLVELDPPVHFSQSSNPNMMPTPIVKNSKSEGASVFVNDEKEYEKVVAKHKERKPMVEDKNQMGARSEPPRMRQPMMPSHIQRPRTLAEKRRLVNNNNVNFLIIEQETKIYKQVQRQKSQMDINYNLLEAMMNEDIPIKHGTWKVLTWLRTREGKYIQQYLEVDGTKVKLSGSRGNHMEKILPEQTCKPFEKYQTTQLRSTRCCPGGRISKRSIEMAVNTKSIQRFFLEESSEQYKRIDTKYLDNRLVSIKPRPLSKKIDLLNKSLRKMSADDDSAFLGDYRKFEMPQILLEVTVQQKTPLDPHVKKYLKEILPHRDMNENWCNFALSALVEADSEKKSETFDFRIPYQNEKTSILVREVIHSKEDNENLRIKFDDEDEEDDMEWTFDKDADKTDPDECEIIEVIKDLTNSVFINLNDDLFTQEDPVDREKPSLFSPIKASQAAEELAKSPKKQSKMSRKILRELRKLNANVVKSETPDDAEQSFVIRNAMAQLGKVERDLRPTVLITESDTVMVGNQEKESRRTKRAPKKFDDYDSKIHAGTSGQDADDDDLDEPAAKKSKKNESEWSGYKPRPKDQGYTLEELKNVRQEVKNMIHSRVELHRLEFLEDIEPWCMVHRLYKCHCRGSIEVFNEEFKAEVVKPTKLMIRRVSVFPKDQQKIPKEIPSKPVSSEDEEEEELKPAEKIVPVERSRQVTSPPNATISSPSGTPKIEIRNVSDLINGGFGPIHIQIYEDNQMRQNPIMRSVLDNNIVIIYFEGVAFYCLRHRVDVRVLDFEELKNGLEHPIFIISSKESEPTPLPKTKPNEFMEFLRDKASKNFVEFKDKKSLRDISDTIDSILNNLRKKIEMHIGDDRNELVKNQLTMLTSDRSRSQSFSSTTSSPLSFHGCRLTEAPPPGRDTPSMKEFNNVFSTRMKLLVTMVSSNSKGLRPSWEMFNKIYVYQWSLLLKSYEEDLIRIWQVTLEGESGEKYYMLAVTDSKSPPVVEHAHKQNVVNIRKLKLSDKMTELARLIILRVENPSMKNMTVLLYGCRGYWRVCGVLNSKESYLKNFVAKPNLTTHPRLAAKIQKTYRIWHASKEKQLEAKRREEAKKKADEIVNEYKQSSQAKDEQVKSQSQLQSLARKPGQADYKWFLFNITDDFSDILIKSWGLYLSYKVIMEAIKRAKTLGRAVLLTSARDNGRNWPKIYALPSTPLKFKEQSTMTSNFLLFGPYMRQSNSNLLLIKNVDGVMMLRDEYERKNNIKNSKRTRCLWIYANQLKCVNEAHSKPLKVVWDSSRQSLALVVSENQQKVPEQQTAKKDEIFIDDD